ncbi:MAG: isoleucine--tRNA ligase [Candidatus Cloacimonetes bacterium]|nr:isoleucine--tRNA ligase [Candidatus Cloacimonadota bacterium]
MYKQINVKEKPVELEKRISSYWLKNNIAIKSEDVREGAPQFIFYEGPPTANGMPGIHHVISRALKDVVCRYKTMRGFQVKRKAGWDTHGLPVEIEIQKELGFTVKKEIEEYGIEKFNQKCRESVFKYEKEWREMTNLLGYWLDMDNPYITLTNDYIETVWWLLNQFWKKGMIYEDNKIVPYCPSCGTPLSSHEVAQGYLEVEDPSIFIKFKIRDEENTYFLAWTTTPWTLISNVALVVHPEYKYVKIKIESSSCQLILAKARLDNIKEKYSIVDEYKGSELENVEYEQLFPFIIPDKKAFYVVPGTYVTMEDGTGIVHTAPAFGEDDYRTGKKYDLPFIQPVNEQGKFTEEITEWTGIFVKDADKGIIHNLKDRGLLYYREQIKHTYPFCWRCNSPLIYFARKSWYIKTTAFADKMKENNAKINWYPKYVGEKRFGDWLDNNIDWAISRDRYWGTPLNIWVCEKCKNQDSPDSIKSLIKKGKMPDGSPVSEDIELHRPYVDDIEFTCPKCGGKMRRTPEVIDCWFDSGAMPFGQWHYPFENSDIFDTELFPADFIAEGIDQTRGWFYTLLAISTFIKGVSSYKSCLVNDLVLDKNGIKMSKSKGNAVDVFYILHKYGADATRWYMLAVSPPWTPTRFDEDGIKEVNNKCFGTLKNVLSFFITYANIDEFDYNNYKKDIKDRPELDRWIISRLNTVIRNVIEYNEKYDLTRSVRLIQTFVINDVSNWYVRRIRKRCWAPGMQDDKISAYLTLYEVLLDISKLCAPFAPFVSEEIYRIIKNKESVHFENFPEHDESLTDKKLEDDMKNVIDIVTLARAARNEVQIKVRQPLRTLYLPEQFKDVVDRMKALIIEEINIKNIAYVSDKSQFIDYEVKPNFKTLGPKYGKHLPHIAEALKNMDANHLVDEINTNGCYHLDVDNVEIKLTAEGLDIKTLNKENFVFSEQGNVFVALDTKLDEELILEGYARELVNKIQFMRKENDFDIMDRIKIIGATGSIEIINTCERYGEDIKRETLANKLDIKYSKEKQEDMKDWYINGKEVFLEVKTD